jgi:hypothetical protein
MLFPQNCKFICCILRNFSQFERKTTFECDKKITAEEKTFGPKSVKQQTMLGALAQVTFLSGKLINNVTLKMANIKCISGKCIF